MHQPPAFVIVQTTSIEGNTLSQRNCALSQGLWSGTRRALKHNRWEHYPWPAVDGCSVTSKTWDDIGVELLNRGKIIDRPGAQGCFMSHWSLWNHCLTFGALTVLEHDAMVQAPWDTGIDYTTALTKLHVDRGTKVNEITGTWGRGAWAYTITPDQADALITATRRYGAQAADKQIGSNFVAWTCVKKDLVVHREDPHPSTTSPRLHARALR